MENHICLKHYEKSWKYSFNFLKKQDFPRMIHLASGEILLKRLLFKIEEKEELSRELCVEMSVIQTFKFESLETLLYFVV